MNIFFYIAAAIAITTSILAISRKNAIHALLNLILSMLSISVVLYLLQAPFIAALEIIIYAGAIMVLFIFVTMILNVGLEAHDEQKWLNPRMWYVAGFFAAILLADLLLSMKNMQTQNVTAQLIHSKQVGISMFTTYIMAVEIAAIILMAGIIGAFHLGSQKKKVIHRFLEKK